MLEWSFKFGGDYIMTMQILRGTPGLNTKKPKVKLTKAKLDQLKSEWRAYNKRMKQSGNHDLRYSTLDEYINYSYGKVKLKKEFKTYAPSPAASYRETPFFPSASISSSRADETARPQRQEYTGTLVRGIATMHKSNAVPIIDDQQAKDIANMRRN